MEGQSPLEAHRFVVNEVSLDQLNKFRQEIVQFSVEHPEVVGAAVFGSQITGRARGPESPEGKSDVDAFVFVDEDIARDNSHVNYDLPTGLVPKEADREKVDQTVGTPFRDRLQKSLQLTEDQKKEIRFRILSKQRIDSELDKALAWQKAIEDSEVGLSNRPRAMDIPDCSLGELFHLQVGTGLDSYRSYILQRLANAGPQGDKVWKDRIISRAAWMESGKIPKEVGIARDANKVYPETVEDARKTYNLKDTTPKYEVVTTSQ